MRLCDLRPGDLVSHGLPDPEFKVTEVDEFVKMTSLRNRQYFRHDNWEEVSCRELHPHEVVWRNGKQIHPNPQEREGGEG